jgi:hypothetical protein
MLWSLDLLITESILFCSMGLLFYWVTRALLILRCSEEQINYLLESDLWWGRRFLRTLRMLLDPSSQLMPI